MSYGNNINFPYSVDLPVRGVPDGCGLEISAPTPTSVPIPSPHELLNLKKGWLMKQGLAKEWQKHWFVLQGSALMYFRDPAAENNGLMDGIIDLGLVQKVGRLGWFRGGVVRPGRRVGKFLVF